LQRLIGEGVLHAAHIGEPETVVTAEARPAVVALEESRVECRAQRGMTTQVADRAQLEPVRRLAANGERVRIVEPERIRDGEPERTQSPAQLLDAGDRGVLEDGAADRSEERRVGKEGR